MLVFFFKHHSDRVITPPSPVCYQVMESEEFQLLPINQLVDIISSDELNVCTEEQVFTAVMDWVRYTIPDRRPHLATVRLLFQLYTTQCTHQFIESLVLISILNT